VTDKKRGSSVLRGRIKHSRKKKKKKKQGACCDLTTETLGVPPPSEGGMSRKSWNVGRFSWHTDATTSNGQFRESRPSTSGGAAKDGQKSCGCSDPYASVKVVGGH